MKHYVVTLLTNTKKEDAPSITVFTDSEDKSAKEKAFVAYHQTLASFINAEDVLYAVVEVQDENGNIVSKEIVDHRPMPQPEPTPEPEPEEVVDVTNE